MGIAMVQFWFEFASTYSYLSAMRIETAAAAMDMKIEWKPFLLGPIFKNQGWSDSPFNIYPAKGRYMWRDMERLCAGYGLTLKEPVCFPQNGLLAARVAIAAGTEAWMPEFVRRVYLANFAEQRDISQLATITEILTALGQDSGVILERAQSSDTKETLRKQSEAAISSGIFGAPSFVVEGELFWGNDRLEGAIAWARGERAGQSL